ncbi:hypothetical protein V6N13_113808 [Hibiscus sabdariffa]|uniref:Uncharacterized protein n=1 Tax=Hibiscus sabdariffa TaxID=183260 RepID=A0ABR2U041_9ROSI
MSSTKPLPVVFQSAPLRVIPKEKMQSYSSVNPQQGSVLTPLNFPPATEGSSVAQHIDLTLTKSHDSVVVVHEGHNTSCELGSKETTHREGRMMESLPRIGSTFSPLEAGPSTNIPANFPTSSFSLDCGNGGNEALDVLDFAVSGNVEVNGQCDMHVVVENEQH